MIIITGAAGFIGSAMAGKLNREGYRDLVLVDDFTRTEKRRNYEGKQYTALVERDNLFDWIRENHRFIQFILHLGARTDTTETDTRVFDRLNFEYSKEIWKLCVAFGLPLVYASSAATYGAGELGYHDDHEVIFNLKPLNPYGTSKNEFDKWAVQQAGKPFFWTGLKFFNVYGPNESHKGRMASVVFHAFRQIRETGKMKLFRSHRSDYADGEQRRDFISVHDVTDVIFWMMKTRGESGLFNLGTGKAETFLTLVRSVFAALEMEPVIEFIDTPPDIRDTYQYFTEADMSKMRGAGYQHSFTSLADGINDYVVNYLVPDRIN